jgi:hypothetical protein
MLKLWLRSLYTAAMVLVLLLGGTYAPCRAAPVESGSEEKAGTSKGSAEKASGGAEQAPAAEGTPEAEQAPEADAKASLADACKKAAADLGSGDLSLKALSSEKREALVQDQKAGKVFTCLAIADDDKSHCDHLAKQQKEECLTQWEIARELKGVPKERAKSAIIYRACVANAPKAECEKVRDAIVSGDATKCQGLSKGLSPDFCGALATGDATKCDALPAGGERDACPAYVTDDPKRCPKDSGDCPLVVATFAKLRKEGLGGLQDIDATLAAASKGRPACTTLLSDLERFCVEGN